jgi:hypothetical protein
LTAYANAIAERAVRTLRNECLDHLLVVKEAHLRAGLGEYAAYCNAERPTGVCISSHRSRRAATLRSARGRSARGPC